MLKKILKMFKHKILYHVEISKLGYVILIFSTYLFILHTYIYTNLNIYNILIPNNIN